jgi:hypothetical protein
MPNEGAMCAVVFTSSNTRTRHAEIALNGPRACVVFLDMRVPQKGAAAA